MTDKLMTKVREVMNLGASCAVMWRRRVWATWLTGLKFQLSMIKITAVWVACVSFGGIMTVSCRSLACDQVVDKSAFLFRTGRGQELLVVSAVMAMGAGVAITTWVVAMMFSMLTSAFICQKRWIFFLFFIEKVAGQWIVERSTKSTVI